MKSEHRANIILYNVLNQEVVFEEYFCNLLSIKKFRELFLEFIAEKNQILVSENIEYKNFDTEVFLNKKNKSYGRADLYLKIKDKEFIFEIKNKHWTHLTDNQPIGYLEYLNQKNEHLFFLIPKGYKHKDEIFEKWKYFNSIDNQIFYWEDFIVKIKNKMFEEIEIKMFYEFCIYWFNMAPIHFSENELNLIFIKNGNKGYKLLENINIPTMINKLYTIVEQARIDFHIENTDNRLNAEWYGYILNNEKYKISSDWEVWFGIDFKLWEKENLPIIIQITPNNKYDIGKIQDVISHKFKYKSTDEYIYIWLKEEDFKNDKINISEKLKNKVNQVVELVKNIDAS